ncbi:MAG: hypothetical protein JWP44_3301, partial [Mucilaginibacter sp.]|nr:hypothetical protein [Mucilaginibacter sp.]
MIMLTLVLAATGWQQVNAQGKKPNIILIVADDMG